MNKSKGQGHPALNPIPDTGGNDFRLMPGRDCWVIVDGVSVWIRRGSKNAVIVELFEEGREAEQNALDYATA